MIKQSVCLQTISLNNKKPGCFKILSGLVVVMCVSPFLGEESKVSLSASQLGMSHNPS